jgi:hypothetical protein
VVVAAVVAVGCGRRKGGCSEQARKDRRMVVDEAVQAGAKARRGKPVLALITKPNALACSWCVRTQ